MLRQFIYFHQVTKVCNVNMLAFRFANFDRVYVMVTYVYVTIFKACLATGTALQFRRFFFNTSFKGIERVQVIAYFIACFFPHFSTVETFSSFTAPLPLDLKTLIASWEDK